MPSSFQPSDISKVVTAMPALFNMLNIQRAIIPAANGHCSARALARYYAALADGGVVPRPHSRLSKPALGIHPHIPKFPSPETSKKPRGNKSKEFTKASKKKAYNYEHSPKYGKDLGASSHDKNSSCDGYTRLVNIENGGNSTSVTDNFSNCDEQQSNPVRKIFGNPRIHDAFLGMGDYANLVLRNGKFGLGFRRYFSKDGSPIGFGHSGMGGSTGFCELKNRFAIAVTLNKMSFGTATGSIIHFVCSELILAQPDEYLRVGENGPDMPVDLGRPLIN